MVKEAAISCAAVFRLQANTCRQLASSATELWVATALTELADALLERADRMAKDASASRSFRRESFEREHRRGR
jgi:hypothetical protein